MKKLETGIEVVMKKLIETRLNLALLSCSEDVYAVDIPEAAKEDLLNAVVYVISPLIEFLGNGENGRWETIEQWESKRGLKYQIEEGIWYRYSCPETGETGDWIKGYSIPLPYNNYSITIVVATYAGEPPKDFALPEKKREYGVCKETVKRVIDELYIPEEAKKKK